MISRCILWWHLLCFPTVTCTERQNIHFAGLFAGLYTYPENFINHMSLCIFMIILAIFTFDRCLVSEFLKANFCPQCVQAYLVVVKMIKVLKRMILLANHVWQPWGVGGGEKRRRGMLLRGPGKSNNGNNIHDNGVFHFFVTIAVRLCVSQTNSYTLLNLIKTWSSANTKFPLDNIHSISTQQKWKQQYLAWALWWRWSFWRVGKALEQGMHIKCFWCSWKTVLVILRISI